MKRILILLMSNAESTRAFLFGFCKYARRRQNWILDIRKESDLAAPAVAKRVLDGFYDGIVAKEGAFAGHPELASVAKTALVLYATHDPGRRKPGDNLVYVQHDDREVGRLAADYLTNLGSFAAYAYVPAVPSESWSEKRESGFSSRLAARGLGCRVHDGAQPLADFLRALPKPAAVMAACDCVALEVLETCRGMRLDVPGKVAVMGVDDDETICEFARPSLTTLADSPRHILGEKAGEAMSALLRGRRFPTPGLVECTRMKVVERESCAHLPQATHIERSAMEFIEKNSRRAIKVGDVVAHLGVSRRLADRQFGQTHGESMLEAITRCRLDEVARLLLISRLPIAKIASLCEFGDLAYLGKLFRRRYGVPMRDYRNDHPRYGLSGTPRTKSLPPYAGGT